MSNYTKSVDFAAKDSLPSGDSNKIIRGSEFETEFDNISTAIATKADSNNTALTGSGTANNLTVSGTLTGATVDINGGAIDGTTIGSSSASSGAFTTLSASGAITGTTASFSGDLAVDTDTLFVDVSADRVGINTSSPASALDVNGTVTADGLTVDGNATIGQTFASDRTFSIGSVGGTHFDVTTEGVTGVVTLNATNDASAGKINLQTADTDRLLISNDGDVSFYEDTGTTAKFFWDASAESLGIGTTSPSTKLEVSANGTLSEDVVHWSNSSGVQKGILQLSSSGGGQIQLRDGGNNTDVQIASDSISYFNGGSVGIGTNNPQEKLHVVGGGIVQAETESTTASGAYFKTTNTAGSFVSGVNNTGKFLIYDSIADVSRIAVDTAGNVGIGIDAPVTKLHVQGSSAQIRVQDTGSGGGIVSFRDSGTTVVPSIQSSGNNLTINTGGSEKVRIDGSGNVGIGTTSPAYPLHVNDASALFGIGSLDDPDTEVRIRKRFDGTAQLSFDVSNVGSPVPCYIACDANENLTLAYNDAVVTTAYLNILNNGSEVARFTSGGNFGVGLVNPTSKLQVGSGGIDAVSADVSGTNTELRLGGTSTGTGNFYYTYDRAVGRLSVSTGPKGSETFAYAVDSAGRVGIGTASPARALHVSDVMRLEPRAAAPLSPSAGDIFFNSTTNKLQCYDGTTWQDCF